MAETFGHTLRQLRRAKGVSQRDLAKRVGVDFSYISKMENDRLPPPSADTVLKICEALEESPDKLLALTGKVPTTVRKMIGTSPAALQFIREAHSMRLSDNEWEKLTHRLRRIRRG